MRLTSAKFEERGSHPTDKFFPKRILKSLRQCPYATDIREIVRFPPKNRLVADLASVFVRFCVRTHRCVVF